MITIEKITWQDSTFSKGWHGKDDFNGVVNLDDAIETVGFVVHDAPEKIIVAQSIGTQVGDLLAIPVSAIRERIVIATAEITLNDDNDL